jgi:hypothetical protein
MTVIRHHHLLSAMFLVGVMGCSSPPSDNPAPKPASLPERPTTGRLLTEKGPLTVPGPAYLDGRDTEAQPPLTIMNINIWDSAARSRPVCQRGHGSRVDIIAARVDVDEDRYYFHVKSIGCEGWLPESFISAEYQPVVGEALR